MKELYILFMSRPSIVSFIVSRVSQMGHSGALGDYGAFLCGPRSGVPRVSCARGQSQFWRPPPRPFVAAWMRRVSSEVSGVESLLGPGI